MLQLKQGAVASGRASPSTHSAAEANAAMETFSCFEACPSSAEQFLLRPQSAGMCHSTSIHVFTCSSHDCTQHWHLKSSQNSGSHVGRCGSRQHNCTWPLPSPHKPPIQSQCAVCSALTSTTTVVCYTTEKEHAGQGTHPSPIPWILSMPTIHPTPCLHPSLPDQPCVPRLS